MDVSAYQEAIKQFYIFDPDDQLQYCLLNLPGEVGELCSLFAKFTRDFPQKTYESVVLGEAEYTENVLPKVEKELGDIFFMLACTCDALGFDSSQILEANLEKLSSRKERNTIQGSGDDR